jgi:hypothetical protein
MSRGAEEINRVAAEIDLEIDALVGLREFPPKLRLSIFRAAEDRARDGLQPALSADLRQVIERFAS